MSKLKNRQGISSAKLIKDHAISDPVPAEKKKPLFSFQFLDPEYCISRCKKDDKAALADQLRILGSQTWAALGQAPRHGIGYEQIKRNAIKGTVPRHIQQCDDVTFFAFRFSGKKAMVGYRDREVFHVIWLDRNFNLYNHG